MSGSHATARVPRLAPRAMALGRELALLGFVAGVTYLAAQDFSVSWNPVPCEAPAIAASIAGCAVVAALVRRRFPVVALLAAALLVGWYPAAAVALALTSYVVVGRVRSARRRHAGLVAAALAPFTVGLIASGYQWKTAFTDFGVVALVCVVGVAVVQVLLGQRERLIGALRKQARYAASAARLQERSRIAQEMHDLLGHRLSLISLYAGSLELDAAKPPHATEPARLIRGTVHTAMDELRATLGMLREAEPGATRPVDQTGTWPDVFQLVRQAQAGGVEVELTWTGGDLVGTAPPIRQAVHRIVREGLTNVSRHAAGAKAEVVVERRTDWVRVAVVDDGRAGTGTRGSGLGLVGVQERVRLLGGTFQAGTARGRGFRVTVELPLSIAPPAPDGSAAESETDSKVHDRWARAGMSAVLATALAGAVAIVVVTFTSVPFDLPGVTSLFDSLNVGTTRAQVADVVGQDELLAHRAARGAEPLQPDDTDCWYSYDFEQDGTTMIERYCFRQDLLVDKARFSLPVG